MARQKRKPGGSSLTKHFGQRLRELRKLRGVTQAELARQVGLSRRMVVYYESQGGSPSAELLARFSKTLQVPCETLLGLGKAPKPTAPAHNENVRLLRRVRRLEELPTHDRKAVLKMINALADQNARRRAG